MRVERIAHGLKNSHVRHLGGALAICAQTSGNNKRPAASAVCGSPSAGPYCRRYAAIGARRWLLGKVAHSNSDVRALALQLTLQHIAVQGATIGPANTPPGLLLGRVFSWPPEYEPYSEPLIEKTAIRTCTRSTSETTATRTCTRSTSAKSLEGGETMSNYKCSYMALSLGPTLSATQVSTPSLALLGELLTSAPK